jgi:alpha-1,3-rhamnosyl/mannosyltransferase
MFGLIALRTSAVFIASCPTSAVNGMREREFGIEPIVPAVSSVETCYKASVPSPLRVLLEASCLADGRREAGIGRYARQLAESLHAITDLEVTASVPASSAWNESRPGRFLHAQPQVLKDAIARHPHLVHGVGGEPVLGFPFARQVVTLHDVELWRGPASAGIPASARGFYASMLAPALRLCAAVIAVSETTRQEAIDTLRLDPARVHVVPNGVSAGFSGRPKLRDARVAEAMGLEGAFVLWVGSLRARDPRKGLDTLLDAMEILGDAAPPLALAGALGPEADRLAADAWRRKVQLVLCGSVDDADLASLYRQAAVMVVPSTHEGFGLTALEAMASAVPVVATAVGSLPDLLRDVGFLVPSADPRALAEALDEVLTDPVRSARMRHAGLVRAAEYTWTNTAEMTADVYWELASTGGAARSR